MDNEKQRSIEKQAFFYCRAPSHGACATEVGCWANPQCKTYSFSKCTWSRSNFIFLLYRWFWKSINVRTSDTLKFVNFLPACSMRSAMILSLSLDFARWNLRKCNTEVLHYIWRDWIWKLMASLNQVSAEHTYQL